MILIAADVTREKITDHVLGRKGGLEEEEEEEEEDCRAMLQPYSAGRQRPEHRHPVSYKLGRGIDSRKFSPDFDFDPR